MNLTTKRTFGYAEVISNNSLNLYYYLLKLRLYGIDSVHAGQFINIKIENADSNLADAAVFENSNFINISMKSPFLMRPFSVGRVLRKETDFVDAEFIIKEVGRGSFLLRHLRENSKLRFLGPLGSYFSIPDSVQTVILVGGGTGIAPLTALADNIKKSKLKVFFFGLRQRPFYCLSYFFFHNSQQAFGHTCAHHAATAL